MRSLSRGREPPVVVADHPRVGARRPRMSPAVVPRARAQDQLARRRRLATRRSARPLRVGACRRRARRRASSRCRARRRRSRRSAACGASRVALEQRRRDVARPAAACRARSSATHRELEPVLRRGPAVGLDARASIRAGQSGDARRRRSASRRWGRGTRARRRGPAGSSSARELCRSSRARRRLRRASSGSTCAALAGLRRRRGVVRVLLVDRPCSPRRAVRSPVLDAFLARRRRRTRSPSIVGRTRRLRGSTCVRSFTGSAAGAAAGEIADLHVDADVRRVHQRRAGACSRARISGTRNASTRNVPAALVRRGCLPRPRARPGRCPSFASFGTANVALGRCRRASHATGTSYRLFRCPGAGSSACRRALVRGGQREARPSCWRTKSFIDTSRRRAPASGRTPRARACGPASRRSAR